MGQIFKLYKLWILWLYKFNKYGKFLKGTELNKEIQKIGEAMYQSEQDAGAQAEPEAPETESTDENKKTQDAEGEVIDQ